MVTIYTITNELTGKCYVGQTRSTLAQRMNGHVRDARQARTTMPLHRAIREFGKENFIIAPVADCQTVEEANNREKLFIIVLRATDPDYGYNVSPGGRNNYPTSGSRYRKMCAKMSASAKARIANAKPGERFYSTTHCPKGHAYEGTNLIIRNRTDGRKHRSCRACAQARDRVRRHPYPNIGRGGLNKRKTHCKRGHEFTPENTIAVDGGLGRKCRMCEQRRSGHPGQGTGAASRVKTHCPKGHPYAGENLIVLPNGWRRCRACLLRR